MKMLQDQFGNYLIEASRLYKKYARAVFPLSAKKCETFFGIFAHIFHKCKTEFNSGVFYLHKRETTFNFGVCFLLESTKCREYQICSAMTCFFEIACQITEKVGLQHNTMTFFFFLEIGIL